MDIHSAIGVVARLEYKPGWQFSAETSGVQDGAIVLEIKWPARNSDAQFAPDYLEPLPFGGETVFYLYVESCVDEDDMEDMLLDCVLRVEYHEIREFFGVRQSDAELAKPYHPHTTDGMHRWTYRCPTTSLGDTDVFVALLGMDRKDA